MTLASEFLAKLTPYIYRFTPFEVDNAPSTCGIYAWYSQLDAGPKDWEMEIEDGEDIGIERFISVIQRHSSRHASPALKINAKIGHLSTWQGEIENTTLKEKEDTNLGIIENIASSQKERKNAVEILKICTPIFSAPLYIGISENINRRLSQHVLDIEKFSRAVEKDPNARETLKQANKNFACRAIGNGFNADSLEVWAIDIESAINEDKLDKKRTIEAAEWLLNRWHRPPLGKR